MSDNEQIKSRLNAALCAFVSVPLTAFPAAAQNQIPGPAGVRQLGVRAIQGRVTSKPLGLRELGDNWVGLRKLDVRVPPRAEQRVPGPFTKGPGPVGKD